MKVSELNNLCVGDVIITCIDTNIFTGEPLKKKLFIENIVTWVRKEQQDGVFDVNDKDDFNVILMDDNGEVSHIRDLAVLDDCEYSHNAFKRGVWTV
jgi:hypothetical protein